MTHTLVARLALSLTFSGLVLATVSAQPTTGTQGEGRYGAVRGTARIPSPEGEVRQVALDVVPTDLLEAIEVSKTLTADMDADSIGGAVNLVTKAAPLQTTMLGTAAGGYNAIGEDWSQGLYNITAGRRFGGGQLDLIGTTLILFGEPDGSTPVGDAAQSVVRSSMPSMPSMPDRLSLR